MRAPTTSGRCASGSAGGAAIQSATRRAGAQPGRIGAERAQVAQPGEAVRRRVAAAGEPTASPQPPGRSGTHAAAELQFAPQQPRAARRIARPGIAHRQRRRVRHPAHAQAGQPRDRPAGIAQPAPRIGRVHAPVRRAARRSPPHSRAAPNTAVPAISVSAPAAITAARSPARCRHPPPARSAGPAASIIRRSAAIFGSCDGQELLAAESGIDRHHQDDVDEIEHPRNGFDRRRRDSARRPHVLPSDADQLQRAVQMRAGLRMHADVIGAGLGERARCNGRPARSSDARRTAAGRAGAALASTGGPKLMFGTKWPSMTSRCSQSAPAASTAATSSPQPGEIGGEQAWRDRDSPGLAELRHGAVLDRPSLSHKHCSEARVRACLIRRAAKNPSMPPRSGHRPGCVRR